MAYPGRRFSENSQPLRIEVFEQNYCSQENLVQVSKKNNSTGFEVLENNEMNRNIMEFTIEDCNGKAHCRRILRNHINDHIVTLKKKIMSIHSRWEAFNEEETVLLFSAKLSGRRKINLFLDVSLESDESNGRKKKLKVTGTYSEGTFKVQVLLDVTNQQLWYNIAEMEAGKVIVIPKVDYALVIALIMIQDALLE